MSSFSRTSLVAGLALSLSVSAAFAQPRTPTPPTTTSRPSLESALPAGARLAARWDLTPDASGTPVVLGQTVVSAPGTADEVQCVIASFSSGAWQVSSSPAAFGTNPADCFTAVLLDNRWVFGRWTLGGSGDGRNRTNDSGVEFFSFLQGRLQSVGSFAVTRFGVLLSGNEVSLYEISPRREALVWSPDHTRLVPRTPPARGR